MTKGSSTDVEEPFLNEVRKIGRGRRIRELQVFDVLMGHVVLYNE